MLAAVKIQSDVSSFFQIALREKQGEPLSPLLFILFINDVYSDLRNADNDDEITGISINHIMFLSTAVRRRHDFVHQDPDRASDPTE